MISKRTRRSTGPVESLHQSGFTAVKGIDISKPLVDPSSVLYSKNLDIATDGGLVLRKPIVFSKSIPEVVDDAGNVIPTKVVHCSRIFDRNYMLVIRCQGTGSTSKSFIRICTDDSLSDGAQTSWNLKWNTWLDYTEQFSTNTSTAQLYTDITKDINLSKASVVHTPTSTVITNVYVNVRSATFSRATASYPYQDTDLFNSKLYDEVSSGTLYLPRTLILMKSDAPQHQFTLKIVTPDVNVLNSIDTLNLNPNLDLDNPYSIRDAYNSSAPTIHNVLMYAPVVKVGASLKYAPEDYTGSSDASRNFVHSNPYYTDASDSAVYSYLPTDNAPINISTTSSSRSPLKVTFPSQEWAYDATNEVYLPRMRHFDAVATAILVLHITPKVSNPQYGAWVLYGIGDTSVWVDSPDSVGGEVPANLVYDDTSMEMYLNIPYTTQSLGLIQCVYAYNKTTSTQSAFTNALHTLVTKLAYDTRILTEALNSVQKLGVDSTATLDDIILKYHPDLNFISESLFGSGYTVCVPKRLDIDFDPESLQLMLGNKPNVYRIYNHALLNISTSHLDASGTVKTQQDLIDLFSKKVKYTL